MLLSVLLYIVLAVFLQQSKGEINKCDNPVWNSIANKWSKHKGKGLSYTTASTHDFEGTCKEDFFQFWIVFLLKVKKRKTKQCFNRIKKDHM